MSETSQGNAAPNKEPRYQAFISYSHEADSVFAPGLRRALGHIGKPWWRLRSSRIFLDATDLEASPSAWARIVRALDDSTYFILLASPRAASSKWVARECKHWLEAGREERLLIALTEGELAWDNATGAYDRERTTALPEPLLGIATEPLWVDLRSFRRAEDRSRSNPDYFKAVARLAARVQDIDLDVLVSQEHREHRRTWATVWSVASVLAALLAVSVWMIIVATSSRQELQETTDPLLAADLVAQVYEARAWKRPDDWLSEADGVLERISIEALTEKERQEVEKLRAFRAGFPAQRRLFEVDIESKYDDLEPLSRDPDSGLREFLLTTSGKRPERNADGKFVVTEETGIVLVLVPGGTFRMGSSLESDEVPVHDVTLGPFLISKYEMTTAQWVKLSGAEGPEEGRGRDPQGGISWYECTEQLPKWNLSLPTEAQWEYACRAGTETRFWPGDFDEDLIGVANLEGADDEWDVAAPVGSLGANAFGLHDVHGNVWEWCQDKDARYDESPPRTGDGLRGPALVSSFVYSGVSRGGSFFDGPEDARSATRYDRTDNVVNTFDHRGVRPARLITE